MPPTNTPPTRVINRPVPAQKGSHFQRLVSGLAAVALAVGTPIGLSRFGVPFAGVDWSALSNQLRIGDVPRSFLVGMVVSLAWFLWANFVWAFAVEWRAQLAGVQAPTIPSAPGTQYLARRIVSGLLFSVHSFGVMAMPPPDLHAVQPVVTVIDDQTEQGSSSKDDAPLEASGPATYVVGRGDTLMSIAAEVLGDDDRWTEIRRLNIGQTRPDGSVMQANETWVMRGQRLLLPDDAIVAAPPSGTATTSEIATPSDTEAVVPNWSSTAVPEPSPGRPSVTPVSAASSDVVEVVAGDNLWTLSSDALEDGWGRDVADAEVAGYHQQVVAKNRSALTSVPADPDLIFPGDRFVLPPVPADPTAPTAPVEGGRTTPDPASRSVAPSSPTHAAVRPAAPTTDPVRDTEMAPDPASRGGAPSSPNGGSDPLVPGTVPEHEAGSSTPREVDGAQSSEPDESIFPSFVDGRDGGTLWAMVPDDRAGNPDAEFEADGPEISESTNPTTGDLAASTPEVGDPTAQSGAAAPSGSIDGAADESSRSMVIGTVGAGLLAAAFVRAYRRRRRIQWQQRPPGRIPEPLGETESLALARLEAIADYKRLDSTEYTITTYDVPESTHVVVDDQEVSVFVPDEPAQMFPAPPATGDLEPDFGVDEEADAWVSLGRDKADGDVVVNLSTIGRLWVSVDDGVVLRPADIVATLATELATSPLNDVRVVLLDPIREVSLERVVVVKDEAALVRFMEADSEGLDRAPVIASTIPLTDGVQRTVQRRGVPAILVGSAPEGDRAWSCVVRSDGTWIDPLATVVRRDWFDEPALAALAGATVRSGPDHHVPGPGSLAYEHGDTLVDALTHPGMHPDALQQFSEREQSVEPIQIADTFAEPSPTDKTTAPQVRVLGRVEITGLKHRLESLRAMGLIAYLAFHRDGADADRLITWVWPDGSPPTPKAFANVVSRARKALGTDADGQPYLQKADANGVYRLSKQVTTDFDDLVSILERAGQAGDEQQLVEYQGALEFVRGVPFTGGGAHGFAWTDHGLRAHVDYTIDEAAHAYGDLAISAGDTDQARWATRIGLQIVPGCEGCYRRRFAAAAADGNIVELRSAMAELERVVSDGLGEPEASDVISKDLLDYYESLLEENRNPTEGGVRQ